MTLFAVGERDFKRIIDEPLLVKHLFDCQPGSLAAQDLPRRLCDLDKAWGGLHYALTGTAWDGVGPKAFLLQGGDEIGSVDVGYGPARGIPHSALAPIEMALNQLSDATLSQRVAEAPTPEVYGLSGDHADDKAYVESALAELKAFIAMAIVSREAIILAMN